MAESLIKIAKDKLDIPTLWRLRGWPREPGKECFRPYAPEDTRKSGSVFNHGQLFRDFKSGETLDAPALLAAVEGMSNSAACMMFIDLAGVVRENHGSKDNPKRSAAPYAPPATCSSRTDGENQAIAAIPPRAGAGRA